MHAEELPLWLDPQDLADRSVRLQGVVPMRLFRRLEAAGVTPVSPDAGVVLRFARHPSGFAVIRGEITAVVRASCQRCLEPVIIEVNREIELAVARSSVESERLMREFETLETDDAGKLSSIAILEDEILLSLPAFPVHGDVAQCEPAMLDRLGRQEIPEEAVGTHNPFAVLKKLRNKDR